MLNLYRRSGEFQENCRPLFYFLLTLAVFAAFVGLAPAASATGPVHRPHGAGWFTCRHDVHADVANNLIVRFPNIYTGCEMDGSLPQLCTQGDRGQGAGGAALLRPAGDRLTSAM
jgi:hypothetical protein